jgi:hypothetical protein
METDESTLRELLTSALAERIGHGILDKIGEGEPLTIRSQTNGAVTLKNVPEARDHLRGLGWNCECTASQGN